MVRRALYWNDKSSVRPSVCPWRWGIAYRDHIGCIMVMLRKKSVLVILACSLFADADITNRLQREHPEILAGIGVGYGKSGFRHSSSNISQTGQIRAWSLLRINSTCFWSVAKSTILNDIMGIIHSVSKHVRHGVVTYLLIVYSFIFSLLLGSKWLQRMFNIMTPICLILSAIQLSEGYNDD